MSSEQRILVIGLGNTLRGDDSLGRLVAQKLRQLVDSHSVKIIDQIGPTPELAAEIAEAAVVIFIDASVDGPEDRVLTRRIGPHEATAASAHQLTASAVVQLARQLYDCAPVAYAITFRARSLAFGDNRLSPAAQQACDTVVEQALDLIKRHQVPGGELFGAPTDATKEHGGQPKQQQ